MEEIIKELEANKEWQLKQIGMTPITNFEGNQELHDLKHELKAKEYENAANVLRAYGNQANSENANCAIFDVIPRFCGVGKKITGKCIFILVINTEICIFVSVNN